MRKLFAFALSICMLMQVNAGLAMQIDMVYAKTHAVLDPSIVAPKLAHPCHGETPAPQATDSNSSPSSHCAQCCVSALPTSLTKFESTPLQRVAPVAELFNNLPAAAQRPSKPPLI